MNKLVALSGVFFLLTSCGLSKFHEEANSKFADQYFKSSIALIELHKTRFGEYPNSLQDLKFLGDWDQPIYSFVSYQKLDSGYRLDVINGLLGAKPEELKYPKEFWNGLGLVESNIERGGNEKNN